MTNPDVDTDSDTEANAERAGDQSDEGGAAGDGEPERTLVRAGRDFEREYRLDARGAGEFLVQLGEQLRDGDELTIVGDEWELPFAFGEPVELEIDFEGVGDPELEIELELPGRTDDRPPEVR